MPDPALPFSRLLDVTSLRPDGVEVALEPSAEERGKVARLLELPAVSALGAILTATPARGGFIKVAGNLTATITQVCVVSLDEFDTDISEPVLIHFAPAEKAAALLAAAEADPEAAEPPDPIIDGKIDLGAVLVEFLALSLDPYPRKPGASFDFKGDPDEPSPFAVLAKLKGAPEA
jgi:uncharacterized metal-binding protein YceD (DUF177 family)